MSYNSGSESTMQYGAFNSSQFHDQDPARTYWGDLVSPVDAPGYRSAGLSNLTVALYDLAKSTSKVRVPCQNASDAKPCLMPEMVLDIFSCLLDIPILPFSENDADASNVHVLDAAFVVFYRGSTADFQMGPRVEG